jgi:hypothetical protein
MLANSPVGTILLGLAVVSLAPGALFAQTPPPQKEADLIALGNKPLTGPQISALLLGNTTTITFLAPVGTSPAGTQFSAFYRDAKTRVVAPLRGSSTFKKYEANWWIEGNQLCAEQVVLAQGVLCTSLYQVSSGIYSCGKDGNCRTLFRVVPGNPEKL